MATLLLIIWLAIIWLSIHDSPDTKILLVGGLIYTIIVIKFTTIYVARISYQTPDNKTGPPGED